MIVDKGAGSRFAQRLSELIAGDEIDPEMSIAPGIIASIDADGRGQYEPTGAEAILIVRGPLAGRIEALKQLLASLETK